MSWARMLLNHSFSILQAERDELFAQLERILKKVRKNMRDRCFNQHDVRMAFRLVGMARMFEFISPGSGAQALEDAEKCLVFKLDFQTELHEPAETYKEALAWISVRVLNVPLTLAPLPPPGSFPVDQPIEIAAWDFVSNRLDCVITAKSMTSTHPFVVVKAKLIPTWTDGKLEIKDIELYMEPGGALTSSTQVCDEESGQETHIVDVLLLEQLFEYAHRSEFIQRFFSKPDQRMIEGYRITGWSILGGSVFARKTYSGSESYYRETLTTFDLKHDPK
jgi:hypothetical protein